MITTPTVLILGAGASVHVRFPTGAKLAGLVLDRCDSEYSQLGQLGYAPTSIKDFKQAFRLSSRKSVDRFLEHRPDFLEIGRAAIAEVLISFENPEILALEENDWYPFLFERMDSDFCDFVKNRLAVVTFNYDRSLEQFLFTALTNSFGRSGPEVATTLTSIPIVHVHGSLGRLPWQDPDGRSYTIDVDPDSLRKAADSIRIVHEAADDDPLFGEAARLLQSAERIVFLGFGYHPTNIRRLGHQLDQRNGQQVIGSTIGMTDLEVRTVNRESGLSLPLVRKMDSCLEYLRECVELY